MSYFMDEALKEALKGYVAGETPVGCVITNKDKIISRAHNTVETLQDSTMHAEIIAIKKAASYTKNWRLKNLKMYVTLEPCLMCAGAILNSRISQVHIGVLDKERGALVSRIPIVKDELIPCDLTVYIYNDVRCEYLLKRFFKNLRNNKKTLL